MSPSRTLARTKYEVGEIRTHGPPFVGDLALPTGRLINSHVTVERIRPAQKYQPPSESNSPVKLPSLLPLSPLKNPGNDDAASPPAIPAVALSFSPLDSCVRLAARLRWFL